MWRPTRATALSNSGRTLNRALEVDRPWSRTVTVGYLTADGSAQEGADYVTKSGRLTFRDRETEQTMSVRLIDDAVEDDGEIFKLILSYSELATIADAEATGTIRDTEPLTASFENAPESHYGSSEFIVRILFNLALAEGSERNVAETLSVTAAPQGDVGRVDGRLDLYRIPVAHLGRRRGDGDPVGDDRCVPSGGRHLDGRRAQALQFGVGEGPRTRVGDVGGAHRGERGSERDTRLRGDLGLEGRGNRDGGLCDLGRQRADISGRLRGSEQNAHVRAGRDGARRRGGGGDAGADLVEPLERTADGHLSGHWHDQTRRKSAGGGRGGCEIHRGPPVVFTMSLSPATSDMVTDSYATSGGSASSETDFTAASGTLTSAANESSKTVNVATTY